MSSVDIDSNMEKLSRCLWPDAGYFGSVERQRTLVIRPPGEKLAVLHNRLQEQAADNLFTASIMVGTNQCMTGFGTTAELAVLNLRRRLVGCVVVSIQEQMEVLREAMDAVNVVAAI